MQWLVSFFYNPVKIRCCFFVPPRYEVFTKKYHKMKMLCVSWCLRALVAEK
jgi:hypothetical protein